MIEIPFIPLQRADGGIVAHLFSEPNRYMYTGEAQLSGRGFWVTAQSEPKTRIDAFGDATDWVRLKIDVQIVWDGPGQLQGNMSFQKDYPADTSISDIEELIESISKSMLYHCAKLTEDHD